MISAQRLIAALWAVTLLAAAPAFGQATVRLGVENHDSAQPVEITSEELSLNQQGGTATFTGGVIVGQGDVVMTCERMVVEYGSGDEGGNEIRVIRMFGGVTFAGPTEAAEAEEAVYTLSEDTIVLTGNVLVTQGATALSSDRLTYNLASGAGQMEGRVKTILNPGNN
ncbi:lipopolysaccharide transport periplasmic protein LptA [Psychromarinibacter halotolerans]|uniref:Lipopolysaccharide transport periplasmic protein LptA n=1 Tax=Psychromarinibacter halotolerans TaxID=1775175 RepID=A0ABV7GN95_9RHOB|nr:lipopolysaccharide transport periplasmic protein LptA [Psychromarinibacter halotolerans]MAQ86059.1 lipopolysaccharide transport periplasmic protein LptA [Maritimibacter sp.]MDF0595756.1 lipopolysaccharide transport periplasmic protein LptA [Psychromarinibacter halotolerans]